jgi:hypothetical protein
MPKLRVISKFTWMLLGLVVFRVIFIDMLIFKLNFLEDRFLIVTNIILPTAFSFFLAFLVEASILLIKEIYAKINTGNRANTYLFHLLWGLGLIGVWVFVFMLLFFTGILRIPPADIHPQQFLFLLPLAFVYSIVAYLYEKRKKQRGD